MDASVPQPGHWPVNPQNDVPIRDDRIWIDGCFDFSHHGHAGAMLQARQKGKELVVGVHSDDEILEHKGPTVMTLAERIAAVEACRWSTLAVPNAPYVTSLPWISHYGCQYVVHGDDVTSDSSGEDCYRYVKAAGRFIVVKRTPGISTTDLVGRMLLCTKTHFIKSIPDLLSETSSDPLARDYAERIKAYATDESGLQPGPGVFSWDGAGVETFHRLVPGKAPHPGQRIVYVDGAFDLFSSGHIEFLRQVHVRENASAREQGWYSEGAIRTRIESVGEDYGPAYVVAGVHNDLEINKVKGLNYPIMNIFERGLCVLQCRYINAVVFDAPFSPIKKYLLQFPFGMPTAVYHGPTSFLPLTFDPYGAPKELGIFQQIGNHDFGHVDAGEIVQRILKSREAFVERQRKKGEKGIVEDAVKKREEMEEALKVEAKAKTTHLEENH